MSGHVESRAERNDMLSDVRFTATGVVGATLIVTAVASAQPPLEPTAGEATFNVFLRSTPVGFERTVVSRTSDGWTIRANGQISAPIDLQTRLFEAVYDTSWRPRQLTIEGTRSETTFALRTTFADGTAANEVEWGARHTSNQDSVDPEAVALPSLFFAGYEALAVRLSVTEAGDELPVYIAPTGQISVRVDDVLVREIQTAEGTLEARIHRITFMDPQQPLAAEVWADEGRRLLRVSLPSVGLDVARDDVVTVSTRLTSLRLPGDEDVRVPSSGFSLAATVTTPSGRDPPAGGRRPAVVLVPGSAPVDRDATMFGVPVFGHLARGLSDAGFLVVRYDKRGIGQSGGRSESATLADYAEDLREVVRYLDDRDDVHRDQIAVVGHSEGGWVGLLAAAREDKIAAVALLATPGIGGADLVLEQQQSELTRLAVSETERQQKSDLQRRIHAAVTGDGSWDDVPDALRRQADTPSFKSFLEFEPDAAIRRVRQPMLVVQGELDQRVPAYHADRLVRTATARSRPESTVAVVRLAGLDHRLTSASSAVVEPSVGAAGPQVAPRVVESLADWLRQVFR